MQQGKTLQDTKSSKNHGRQYTPYLFLILLSIDMDPAYGKAYGRMGLAYACVDKHKEAIDCFKKAIELEPDNESYKSNMKLAQDKLSAAGGISTGKENY